MYICIYRISNFFYVLYTKTCIDRCGITYWIYPNMSHFDTCPQIMGVSTVFRFQNPTTSNIKTLQQSTSLPTFPTSVAMYINLGPPNLGIFMCYLVEVRGAFPRARPDSVG